MNVLAAFNVFNLDNSDISSSLEKNKKILSSFT